MWLTIAAHPHLEPVWVVRGTPCVTNVRLCNCCPGAWACVHIWQRSARCPGHHPHTALRRVWDAAHRAGSYAEPSGEWACARCLASKLTELGAHQPWRPATPARCQVAWDPRRTGCITCHTHPSLTRSCGCAVWRALHCTSCAQAQGMQTVLLFCLGALALSSTPFADSLEAAIASPTGAPSSTLAAVMQLVFGLVVPAVAVGWAFVGQRVVQVVSRV